MSVLPQELQDKIFMYLDYSTLVECRDFQSPFIQKYSEFSTLEEAVENGNTANVTWLLEKGVKPKYDIIAIARKYKYNELANWLIQNRTKYKNLDKMITRYEQCPQFAVMEWCFYLGSKTQKCW
jgi:hypothetical protein